MINVVESDLPLEYLKEAVRATIVGIDIETSGLHVNKGDRIACVQVYVPDYGTAMVRYPDNPFNLMHLLNSYRVTKIFQYAHFDLGFLFRDFGTLMRPHKICDTKVAADILDPDNVMFDHPVEKDKDGYPKKSHSLIALVHHHFGYTLNKELAVSNWFADVLLPEQLQYAEDDVKYLPELLRKLEMDILDRDPLLVHELNRKYRAIPSKAIAQLKQAA